MRKLSAGLFISLDGVTEAPHRWRAPFTAEDGKLLGEGLAKSDAMLLGTNTYLEFADYWPNAGSDVPMAAHMNETTKYVASRTLDTVEWENSELLKGDLAAEVARIKALPGKNIQVPGSPRLVRVLLENGLLDELALMVQPVALGTGTRLFDDLSKKVDLTLVDSSSMGSGAVLATYVPAG